MGWSPRPLTQARDDIYKQSLVDIHLLHLGADAHQETAR